MPYGKTARSLGTGLVLALGLGLMSASLAAQPWGGMDLPDLPAEWTAELAWKSKAVAGISSFSLGRHHYLGYSAKTFSLVFQVFGSTEGIGGNPDISYVRISLVEGREADSVQADFNRFARNVDYDDETALAALDKEAAAMKAKADRVLASWAPTLDKVDEAWPLDPGQWPWEFVALRDGGDSDDIASGPWCLALGNRHHGWLKALAGVDWPGYGHVQGFPVSLAWLSRAGVWLAGYSRTPVMEFDEPDTRYLMIPPRAMAQLMNENGFAAYGKKDWAAALKIFSRAVELWPKHQVAVYNAACCAALLNQAAESVSWLERLSRLAAGGDTQAQAYLKKVAKDSDFNPVRQDPAFKAACKDLGIPL